MAHSIVLPNMLANWKWPRRINPHYEEVKRASAAWLAGFGAFSPRAQHAFDRCDFSMWIAGNCSSTLLLHVVRPDPSN